MAQQLAPILALVAAACRTGGPAPRPTVHGRPAVVTATCDRAALAGLAPALPGLERGEVIAADTGEPAELRRHERRCAADESDDACRAAAAAELLAARPGAEVFSTMIDGPTAGYRAALEVDGARHELQVADHPEVVAEARRLRSAGHQVPILAVDRVTRAEDRSAEVSYAPPGTGARLVLRMTLRWPLPADGELPAQVERLSASAATAGAAIVDAARVGDWYEATVACP